MADLTTFTDIFSERRKYAIKKLATESKEKSEESMMVWQENEKLVSDVAGWETTAIQFESENTELKKENASLRYRVEETERVRHTDLVADPSPQYRRSRLYLESLLRRTTPTDDKVYLGHQAALNFSRYQLVPAHRALGALRPAIGIFDGVGIGKTLEVGIMAENNVNPQRITPLLSLSGHDFEEDIEKCLRKRFNTINYAEKSAAHDRPSNNNEIIEQVRKLARGNSILLLQSRLEAELLGWRLRGDVDLMKLDRSANGTLSILIGDMKSTTEVKVEHRLQVAFYRIMLEQLLKDCSIKHRPIQMGILLRPGVDLTPEEEEEIKPLREAAKEIFGLDDALLEVVADPEAYLQSADDLVLGKDSVARKVSQTSFDSIPYCLSFKCDGCLYNEFCLKWSAEKEDLSLLPYMTGTEKEALRRAGITTVQSLATLKEFASKPPANELVPAPGREAQVKQLAASWAVGSRLDELVHRARSFRRSVRKDGTQALSYIPGKGNSSLPVSRPDLNPNLVRIYLDAQQDYLEGRVYLLGALVVACKDGAPVARRAVVHMTDGPPDTVAKERRLFVEWTKNLLKAVVEIAVSDAPPGEKKSSPLHIIFFDRYEQRLMLEALARNFPTIIQATPPLYDFLTQIAAFDSPIASYLDEEMRTFKNFPMTCQSLQSVAAYLKFDWSTPHKFRELFKARLFDYIGKLENDGTTEWFTRRSRFASSVPLEYAYAAWRKLPKPSTVNVSASTVRPTTLKSWTSRYSSNSRRDLAAAWTSHTRSTSRT